MISNRCISARARRATSIALQVFLAQAVITVAAGSESADPASQADPIGFLQCPAKFKALPGDPGLKVWKADGADLSNYSSVYVEQPEIFIASDSQYKGIEPDQINQLAKMLQKELVDALGDEADESQSSGKDVIGFRVALTNVYLKKKHRLLSFTPIGLAVGLATKNEPVKDIYTRISLKQAVIKIEALDTATESCLGAAMIRVPDDVDDAGGKSWDALNAEIAALAKRFDSYWSASRSPQ